MEPLGFNYMTVKNIPVLKTLEKGKFEVKDQLLGKGSFAKTYLAVNTETKQLLACKMINKQELVNLINEYQAKNTAKNYFVKALKNEMITSKKVKHQNIVSCEEVLETPSNIYFFLELCNNGTLFEKLQNGKLPYEEGMRAIREIVEGCVYLYKQNIFHRDLKPENILIKNGIYKISDFGFAKCTEEAMKDSPQKGTMAGTPIYMSPQVLKGQPYSLKCDVWSLGVIFYKILFGWIPFDEVNDRQKFMKSLEQPINFPPSQPLPKQVKQIISGMLAYKQANRLSIVNVKEMLDEFGKQEVVRMEVEE